ncbi:MAG: efflux RND transporter periplasmic adaptor subunit [Omnitrophica WOR_2 bacterium]
MRRRFRSRWVTPGLYGFLFTACLVILSACANAPSQLPTPTPIPTSIVPVKPTYQVARGDIALTADFNGRIAPVLEQSLFFHKDGRIAKVLVKEGDVVTKTQVLATLDTGSAAFDLQRAQVNLEIAQINLELARQQTPKWSQDYPLIISLKEREVKLAQINLDELNASVADSSIQAPFNGKILSLTAQEGALAQGYSPVLVLADVSQLEVRADVISLEMNKLSEGMPVVLTPANRPGEALDGFIRKLPYPYGSGGAKAPGAQEDDSIRISFKNPATAGNFTLGDLVRIRVILESKSSVLWLPIQAVRNYEGRSFVVVQDGQGQRRVDIRTGIQGNERVEILDGLTEGQVVVSP